MSSADIKDNILHPYKYNLSTGNTSLELWNKGNTAMDVNSNTVSKTIYSPSPNNWGEPKSAAFNSLKVNGYYLACNIENSGIQIYFPPLGWREIVYGGIIYNVGTGCTYWYVSPYNTSNAWYMQLDKALIQSANSRGYGFPLRSVSE